MKRPLVFLELNEINFDIAKLYLESGVELTGFKKAFEGKFITTESEKSYEKLEPWIQWASVHTGLSFEEHNIFRLGDIVKDYKKQIFEHVENKGFSVGAISAMNSKNCLENPSYFIPDPWTKTTTDGSWLSNIIYAALSQTVNDNAEGKINLKSFFFLIIASLFCFKIRDLYKLSSYAISCIKYKYRKALFLDKLLFSFHKYFYSKKKPDFSTIFLNGGAHIQHHYFFNSKIISYIDSNPEWYLNKELDPILDMLKTYDEILDELISSQDFELLVATGLSQEPYKRKEFYYRLKDHGKFFKRIGIKFKEIFPRMTRDFLVTFDSLEDAIEAKKNLSSIRVNGKTFLFEEIEVRKNELFITLTYPFEIKKNSFIEFNQQKIFLEEYTVFVALKNGMHTSKGYAYFSDELSKFAPSQNSHVKNLFNTINSFFDTKYD
tara:strand:- start:4776 stop:6080 length:1305 start_codon:yes stop_codon:yes gene_type:complete